jgi:hypothetical protein
MQNYDPLSSFPYSDNRLVIIDWASLSYHQWHAINTKINNSSMFDDDGLDGNGLFSDGRTSQAEISIWRTSMLSKVLKYVKLFNPIDMVLALEGTNVWRNGVVKEYYENNCRVHYDTSAYYIRYDNFLYKVTKKGDQIHVAKLDIVTDAAVLDNPSKLLGEMPSRVKDMLWNAYLPNGTSPLLPVYKGKRQKQVWDFVTDKKYWREYKDEFAHEIANLFRSKPIRMLDAEGDDIIYVTCNYYKDKYDSIILITGDSDMNQLLTIPNLKIYNHRLDQMIACSNPEDYLELKILQGDTSDNINGMALPGKKNQLGEKGAEKLFEANSNVYQKAISEGWENQYRRNQTLIDLSYIPTRIQRTICEMLDATEPELCELDELYGANFTKKKVDEMVNLKNLGIYLMLNKEYVTEHPDIFNPEIFAKEEAAASAADIAPKRVFGDISGVFDDPLSGEGIF